MTEHERTEKVQENTRVQGKGSKTREFQHRRHYQMAPSLQLGVFSECSVTYRHGNSLCTLRNAPTVLLHMYSHCKSLYFKLNHVESMV